MNDSLKKFIDGLPPEHRKSNVYHIICQNKDGEITDEKFGINVYTDYGFNIDIRRQNTAGMNTNGGSCIFLGNGSGTPSSSDLKLFSDIKSGAKENRLPSFFCYMVSSSDNNSDASSAYRVTNDLHNTYDAESNMIIGRRLCETVTLAYNYSWWDTDQIVTEFGEGYFRDYASGAWDPTIHDYALTTHSLVYDENHQPSSFTKHLNEQITITLYRTACIKCDLFATLWNQGKYLFVNPAYLVHGFQQDHGHSSQGYSWWGNSWHPVFELSVVSGRCLNAKDFPLYPVQSTTSSSTNYYNWGENLDKGFGSDSRAYMARATAGKTGMVYGWEGRVYNTQHANGWRSNMTWTNAASSYDYGESVENSDKNNGKYGLTVCTSDSMGQNGTRTMSQNFWYVYNNQATPEELVHYYAYTDDFRTPNFRNIFGLGAVIANNEKHKQLQIPVNDFHITSLKQYNYLTDDWDIDEQFVDDPTFDLRNPECALCGQMMLNEFKNGNWFSVYLNSNPAAITAFTNPNTEEIYMTDSYWDVSSYVLVEDHMDVPLALQHKKYIIKYPQQSSWKGIYPVREHSQHALVPSTPIQEVDINVHLEDYTCDSANYGTKIVYASDDGWIYCDGTLIYPDSDDGTGHPYKYTLTKPEGGDSNPTGANRNSMRFMYYTKHAITQVAGYKWIYNILKTDTTVEWITIYHPDPEHPDVDPMTTKTVYYANDLFVPFGLYSGNYITPNQSYVFDNFCFAHDEENDRLYVNRDYKLGLIDTTSSTANIEFLEKNSSTNMLGAGSHFSPIYGTDLLVLYNRAVYDHSIGNTVRYYDIYDLQTRTVIKTFSIPTETTLTVHWFFGYKNKIYLQTYKDDKYYLFTYDYNDEYWTAKPNFVWNFLWNTGYNKFSSVRNQIYWDNEVFVASAMGCVNRNHDGDVGCRTFAIFADDLTHPVLFETASSDPFSTSFTNGYNHDMPRVKKFDNGKHWVMLYNGRLKVNGTGSDGVNHSAAYVIDLGYIKNKGLRSPTQLYDNLTVPAFRMPNKSYGLGGAYLGSGSGMQYISDYVYDSNNLWFAETCFYKNKVCVITTFGKMYFIPVEMFLPHKMTGTTRSHQAYNKRKVYHRTSHGMVLNNSANVNNS